MRASLRDLRVVYEPDTLDYRQRVRGAVCKDCASGNVERRAEYTPDFRLVNRSYVEAKGKFTSANRTRLLDFKATRPDIVLRLLFQRDNWLTKKHKAKYSDWAKSHGFECAIGENIPAEWAN